MWTRPRRRFRVHDVPGVPRGTGRRHDPSGRRLPFVTLSKGRRDVWDSSRMRILPLLPSMLGAVLGCSSSSSSGGGGGPSGPPVTLAAGLADPYAIAVGSTGVYWSNVRNAAGTIMAAPTDGGSVTTIASGQSGPYGVAVDPTYVYWTDQTGGTVMMVPLTGGAATTLASGQLAPRGIAVDGAHVYWTCAVPCGSDGGPCGGAVMSVPLGGGTPVTLVSNQDTPWAIAVERHQRVLDEQRPGHR